MRRLLILTALLTTAWTAETFGQETSPAPRDTIRKADGKILANLAVLRETPTTVEVDTDGDGKADQTLDQNEVKSIDYGGAPTAYTQALAYFRVRQYDKAVASFREAAAEAGTRRWVRDYSSYYVAMCLAKQAEIASAERPRAVQAFETLLRDPDNRWRDEAKYQLGQVYLDAGDRAQALATFEALEKDAHREETRLNAAAGLGALLMADNKLDEARRRYDTIVERAKDRFPDLYVSALVGKAQAEIALKRYAEAEKFLTGVLATSTNEDVLAKAHAALGDCFFAEAEGVKKGDPDARSRYKAALKQYLWNVVVFYNQRNECARSLLFAGKCWDRLEDPTRADELYRRLRGEFATTQWATMVPR